ncbi:PENTATRICOPEPTIDE REPEAT-CONTAINING PROTEIN [Salix purpurea]|uniref:PENTATRICOPEPTIDE REPEAT-CONTAINING PROTEIN n=1 Tax=Salix purpurea TaxID=77065 RepID=A0A9Q0Q194_SALPP|nr:PENTATRICOPEPTIDE REPEAT-CONTAINING PROTEIN [Salix purpurea]
MALVLRRVPSLAKRGSKIPQIVQLSFPVPCQTQHSFSTSSSSSDPLLTKLLQTPTSKIISTLDSDHSFNLKSSQLSWDPLITDLRSSSPDKANLVLEWRLRRMLDDDEIDHDEYSRLISLCGKIHNVSLAMHVFTSMEARGIKPTTSVFNSLVYACLLSSNAIIALSLFEIMENSESYQPNSETYDNFVAGFSNLRDVNKMQAWFVGKRAAGFSANLQNYECLISGCVEAIDFDTADKLYEEMMSSGIMPSLHIMEWVLEGRCKQGSCDQVKEFLNFLLECKFEINGKMIENVVRLYSDLGKVDEMEMLLEFFTEFNQAGEALLQLHCGIIRFYAMMDRLDDVEFSVGRMMSQGMSFKSPSDVEKVISSYFRQGAYERLDLFLEHIKRYFKLTRSTYDLLVAGYRRVGLTEKLNLVMEDMILAGL